MESRSNSSVEAAFGASFTGALAAFGVSLTGAGAGAVLGAAGLALAAGRDGYEMFLGGTKALLTIENPNAGTGRELVLFRDSFGSSIAPLLAQGYARVTVVDIRYMSPALIGRFADLSEADDVLFLYSTGVINHSETIQ